ncbi:MAG: spore maturation protein [Oscillospiraceae bacterium]|jgi:spore maturation protein B|nr:spore maturation protein [Oscillospiraceae bacterium]
MDNLGSYILLSVAVIILGAGFFRKVPVFDEFLEGAREGIKNSFSILPALVGLIVCVSMLRASGTLDALTGLIAPAASKAGIPKEIIPLALVRPISGSGALAAIKDVFARYGTDSFAGRAGSVLMGSTETTFYSIAVYFGSCGIKKTGITLIAALAADFTGLVVSSLVTSLYFY